MLVYRVFPYLSTAAAGEPGHPLYGHRPQRSGRIDNPDYHVWYVGRRPEVAVGEAFGNLSLWEPSIFDVPFLPGSRRALAILQLPDELRLLDLDDPRVLVERSLRPTQIVTRNLSVTQGWGRRIWQEVDPHDASRPYWQAIQWWSYHHPSWEVLASWERPKLVSVEPLDLEHDAVVEAAKELRRLRQPK